MKKKVVGVIIASIMTFSFVGCGDNSKVNENINDKNQVGELAEGSLVDSKEEESKTEVQVDEEKNSESIDEKKQESTMEAKSVNYLSYYNSRFGFKIEYPDFLIEQPAPDNNDGRIFESSDGKVRLVASGINNAMFMTLQDAFDFTTRDLTNITYQNISERSFVVSWEENDTVFYQCEVVGEGSMNQFVISYPKEYAEEFNNIVGKCYDSFIPGDLDKCY